MSRILVDTDILIDVANNDAPAKARLTAESQNSTLVVSTITTMELIVGCRNKSELQTLNRFLSQFQILTLTQTSSDRAAELQIIDQLEPERISTSSRFF
jgi:predicted nucleic acid-binding protein